MWTEDTIDWTREWKQQIRTEARQHALAEYRALLVRQTKKRFGEAYATALAPLLKSIENQERLADIGEWIVDCDNGDELLARIQA